MLREGRRQKPEIAQIAVSPIIFVADCSLKSGIDKLDIDKLETIPVNLSKLSDAVKSEVVEKTEYNELFKKVNPIQTTDTSNLVKKTDYDTKIGEIEKKILIMIMLNILLLKILIS